jgi:catechol 2,3-dioxygenase-like lactoylglutathione lyase family enzyme
MAINIETPGIHHISLRSADLARSKAFYLDTLGFPLALETDNLFIFVAGGSFIGVRGPNEGQENKVFNPFNVGLDHLALGCTDEAELHRVANALKSAGVENTGVKMDQTLGKYYVAFKDPDRISWEFYMI